MRTSAWSKCAAAVMASAVIGCGGGGGGGSDEPELILGSREAPVSVGVEHGYTDGINFTVLSTVVNANEIVANENMFNDPVPAGKQYFLVRIRITNSGAFTEYGPSGDVNVIGARGQSYDFRDACGVIPDDCNYTDIATGGTYECNLCWAVGTDEAGSMLLFRDSANVMEQTGEPFFFATLP